MNKTVLVFFEIDKKLNAYDEMRAQRIKFL